MRKDIVELVLLSKKKLSSNRSTNKLKEHDKAIRTLDSDTAQVFSQIWFRVIDVWECFKDRDSGSWSYATEAHHSNLDELSPHQDTLEQDILIYKCYMASMKAVVGKHHAEWGLMNDNYTTSHLKTARVAFYNEVDAKVDKKQSHLLLSSKQVDSVAVELKKLYIKNMSLEVEGDSTTILAPADMNDVFMSSTDDLDNKDIDDAINTSHIQTAEKFYHDVIVPSCDLMASMYIFFNPVEMEKGVDEDEYVEVGVGGDRGAVEDIALKITQHEQIGKQTPNMSSAVILFEQALNVHSVVEQNYIDKHRTQTYLAMLDVGAFKGEYDDFKKRYPSPTERANAIVDTVIATVAGAMKLDAKYSVNFISQHRYSDGKPSVAKPKLSDDGNEILKQLRSFLHSKHRFYR